ncbi:MAG: hypothetical protein ABI700_04610 [Chloroflexota bacterium]
MYFYQAYALKIASTFPLAPLPPIPACEPDVRISLRDDLPLPEIDTPTLQIRPDGIGFWWHQLGLFLIRQGAEIIIQPVPGADMLLLIDTLLTTGMAVLLHQRGLFLLHASAVAIDGVAVAFVGESGFGKSTTAAAFGRYAHPAICDDVAAINLTGIPLISPAYPQVKLLEDALKTLGAAAESFPLAHGASPKRLVQQSLEFPLSPLPLRAVYLLDRGALTTIETIAPAQALVDLFPQSYIARLSRIYGAELIRETGGEAAYFRLITDLISRVPIRRLRRTFAAGELSALPEHILADLSTLP